MKKDYSKIVIADSVSGDEKDELFKKIDSNHPLFKGYRKLVKKILQAK